MTLSWAGFIARRTYSAWSADGGPRMGAALAYYTFFSLAPLVIIVTAVAGLIFGEDAARGELFRQMRGMIGPEAAAAIEKVVARADRPAAGGLAAIIGFATLLLGASAMVAELEAALNHIWKAQPVAGAWASARKRLASIAGVLGAGFLLLVSLLLNAALSAAGAWVGALVGVPEAAVQWANTLASFALVVFLFAAIFKWLPDVPIAWREVWLGAAVTAALFTLGKTLLGLYLGRGLVSPYGAAGSLVLVLLWVYYSAQILYLGAEFTKVHAELVAASGRVTIHPGTGEVRVRPAWLRERRSGHERRRNRRAGGDRRARPHGLAGETHTREEGI